MSWKNSSYLIAAVLSFQFVTGFHHSARNGNLYHFSQLERVKTILHSQVLVPQHLELNQQIFCNVELNGENLEAVGFDMDFTLAQVN